MYFVAVLRYLKLFLALATLLACAVLLSGAKTHLKARPLVTSYIPIVGIDPPSPGSGGTPGMTESMQEMSPATPLRTVTRFVELSGRIDHEGDLKNRHARAGLYAYGDFKPLGKESPDTGDGPEIGLRGAVLYKDKIKLVHITPDATHHGNNWYRFTFEIPESLFQTNTQYVVAISIHDGTKNISLWAFQL